jgi:hypothetical protein
MYGCMYACIKIIKFYNIGPPHNIIAFQMYVPRMYLRAKNVSFEKSVIMLQLPKYR